MAQHVLDLPLKAFSRARSAGYAIESLALLGMARLLPGYGGPRRGTRGPEQARVIRHELLRLLDRDSENIRKGLYPISVLRPESPVRHLKRIPRLVWDGLRAHRQRRAGTATRFRRRAKARLDELPRYYRRNFHFQMDGYLSEESAELYEHQVEILFLGAADPMRRLVIPPLRARFGATDGKGLTFLEIGCGTGRATRFVKLAFPAARVVAVDLSDPYLKAARTRLADLERVDFLMADGAKLPFQGERFDAAYSVFLHHELPRAARAEVMAECRRVLKPGGISVHVDSLQLGDLPELDGALEAFPQEYHEPFYRDYLRDPLDAQLAGAGFREVRHDRGFFSKVAWGQA
jgi:ubiquinone/menaquinone biosynthesis C-methylase UbiE